MLRSFVARRLSAAAAPRPASLSTVTPLTTAVPPTSAPVNIISGKAINYHFTRKCNFACKFCFHTAKTSFVLSADDQRALLRAMRNAGAAKVNFAGGEPFLYPDDLGAMVQYAKEEVRGGGWKGAARTAARAACRPERQNETTLPHRTRLLPPHPRPQLAYESVSIITNGSRVTEAWFAAYGRFLDILGVSVDSVAPATLYELGRWPRGARAPNAGDSPDAAGQLRHVRNAARLADEFGVKFKLNTVVTSANDHEDLTPLVNEVRPMRWKIFQVSSAAVRCGGPGQRAGGLPRNRRQRRNPPTPPPSLSPTPPITLQVLPLEGENTGPQAKPGHDVTPLLLDTGRFHAYVARAKSRVFDASIVEEEDNGTMRSSYLLLDEYGRFLDSSQGGKRPTESVLLVGAEEAARQLAAGGGFDEVAYDRRGADYPDRWSRDAGAAPPAPAAPATA